MLLPPSAVHVALLQPLREISSCQHSRSVAPHCACKAAPVGYMRTLVTVLSAIHCTRQYCPTRITQVFGSDGWLPTAQSWH